MLFMTISHPGMPFLDMAVFTIARCLYISHLCGLSGIPPTIVVILDRCSPEHMLIFEDAGLAAKALVAMTATSKIAYFTMDSIGKNGRICQVCCSDYGLWTATERKDSDTHDEQNDYNHADPSESTRSPTHAPSPSVAHHRCSPSKRFRILVARI